MGDENTRWTIIVDKQTDINVRTRLAERGMKKGDLSKFVEDAVRWRMFDRRVQSVRNSVRDVPAAELQATIDESVREVRKEARRRKK